MFKEGKTIDQIAIERGLAVSTICTHLSSFISSGLLNIDKFISADKREKALKLMQDTEELGSVYQTLSSILNNHEVNFFLSWMRNQKKADDVF